jgi:hypothetical protein
MWGMQQTTQPRRTLSANHTVRRSHSNCQRQLITFRKHVHIPQHPASSVQGTLGNLNSDRITSFPRTALMLSLHKRLVLRSSNFALSEVTGLWAAHSAARIPTGAGYSSLLQNVRTGCAAHTASCSMATGVPSRGGGGGGTAGALGKPLTSISRRG